MGERGGGVPQADSDAHTPGREGRSPDERRHCGGKKSRKLSVTPGGRCWNALLPSQPQLNHQYSSLVKELSMEQEICTCKEGVGGGCRALNIRTPGSKRPARPTKPAPVMFLEWEK